MAFRLLLSLIVVLISTSVAATQGIPRAYDWLQRMNQANFKFNYEGHFVYLNDNTLEAMRIKHRVVQGVVQEHLMSLNGAAREVIRDKSRISIIQPHGGKIRMDQHHASGGISTMLPVYTPELEKQVSPDIGYQYSQ